MYWPKMQEQVLKYIIDYMIYSTNMPSNMKLDLYQPLTIPMTKRYHDYLFIVVDRFSNVYFNSL